MFKTDYEEYLSFDKLQNEVQNHNGRWTAMTNFLKNRNAEGTFLDVGAGTGELERRAKQAGLQPKEWLNVDIREEYIKELLLRHQKAKIGNVTHLPFFDRAFDTVCCAEVLEHLSNPGRGLAELCRVAKKRVILTLPCKRSQDPWHGWLISAEIVGEWVVLELERKEENK